MYLDDDLWDNWQRYYVRLQDTSTGEFRDIAWDYPNSYDEDFVTFYWTEGNAACDCNRAFEFYRGTEQEAKDFPCGDTRIVLIGIWCDGKCIFRRQPDGQSVG